MKKNKYYISTLSKSTYGAKGLDCQETEYTTPSPFFEGTVAGLKLFVTKELLPLSKDKSYTEVAIADYLGGPDELIGIQIEFWHSDPYAQAENVPKHKLAWMVTPSKKEQVKNEKV